MDIGEDLSWLTYEAKLAQSSTGGSIVCRALQSLCKKAALRYSHTLGCFWGGDKSMVVDEESKSSCNLSKSSSSKRSADGKRQQPESPKALKRQHSKKTFSRVTSWSHYLDGGGKEDAVPVLSGNVPDHYMTDLSELLLGQKFASGSYSRLYHGFYKQQAVAVKLIMPPPEDEAVAARLDQQFCHEVALLSRLHHRNILEFVSACKKPPVFCVITEYLPGGSLKTFLHKSEPYSLPIELVTRMAIDTASGMEYLHSQGIIHRDLKSDNLIMTEDLHIKVADFGVSCLESHKDSMKGYTGTCRWMAPEMIKEKPCSRKVDVYSFAIVLWELLTCLTPYEDMTPVQAAFAVSQKNSRPAVPPHCPKEIAKLMKKCWSTSPAKRPEFSQIVKALKDFQSSLQCGPMDGPNFFLQMAHL
ncbi:hypothetical protein GOP47_0005636 [Adiantum capillus-veneris]|uniref:Protein kinase domain-containing protein n=1 Tax=Adiantum capillus-veneris TaxID=13818 RepID=A0A9D4V734_ADICA|nr:hypothetical protein GOP47_0004940 [Adiantum capillus-veneris]KAI5080157.1 hypothetical protein GOP47_0005636 [Adiantum capillus-veneris]